MHSQFHRKEGRVSIIPRARKSIHDHEGHCLIKACNMGRYGINKKGHTSQECVNVSRPEDGRDEVDNVLSKPIPVNTEKQKQRKKSLPTGYAVTDDSDEECNLQLSKSLPSILPSYYSGENGNISAGSENNHTSLPIEYNSYSNSHNNSRLNSSNYSNNSYSLNEREISIQDTLSHQRQSLSGSKNYKLISGIVLILACLIAAAYYKVPIANKVSSKSKYNEDGFQQDMNRLAEKYKVTDTSILKVTSGLSTIFDREDTGCFIFLHNSQNNGFDETLFDEFVESVATASARYLRNESETPPHHVHVDQLDMKMQGELLNKYRNELQTNGVMLVKKLEQIPSNLAMAFHYYCDDYNPVAKKSAVFFTLDLAKCAKPTDRRSNLGNKAEKHADVEKCLASKWNGVPADNIQPLVTRVANIIIDLSKVF